MHVSFVFYQSRAHLLINDIIFKVPKSITIRTYEVTKANGEILPVFSYYGDSVN